MGLLNRLIQKFKPKAKPPEEEALLKKESDNKLPEEKGNLNEEMVSEGVEMEPAENEGFPEIFEKEGEKEAEEKAEENAPEETKKEE